MLNTSSKLPGLIRFFYLCLFPTFLVLWLAILVPSVQSTYLEDDILWFLPLIHNISQHGGLGEIIHNFHINEFTFLDGIYFYFMHALFGLNMGGYVVSLILVHALNSILLGVLLVRTFKLSMECGLAAMLIYLLFRGNLHAILWPMAMHHLITVFYIFFILLLYLKTEEAIENFKPWRKWYGVTLTISLFASFARISILMIPIMILVHLMFTARDSRELSGKFERWLPICLEAVS